MRVESAEKSQLNKHYAWCRTICLQSNSSFVSAFRLLDRRRRQAMYALYAFARITDDLADLDAGWFDRQVGLDAWQAQLECVLQPSASLAHTSECNPLSTQLLRYQMLWPALADTVRLFDIPPHLLREVVTGVRLDLDHSQPTDWDQLRHYCYHVASTVGLACVHIWRSGNELETQSEMDCGIAFLFK